MTPVEPDHPYIIPGPVTGEDGEELSPRRRAEAMAAAGMIPPAPPDVPPSGDRLCHACGQRMDPVLIQIGDTLHPLCAPPAPDRRRTRRR